MKYIVLIFLSISLYAESTFISPMEYASQLYKNPRGIGCQKCHGDKGEGKLIAKYIHKNVQKEFRGPIINGLDFKVFEDAMNKRRRGMPSYFLTTKEIQALFLYLQEEKNR